MRCKTECAPRMHKQICAGTGMHDLTKYGCRDTVKQDTPVSNRINTRRCSLVPGNIQPCEIKVEKALFCSKGIPLNSYIRERALSLVVSRSLTRAAHKHSVDAYNDNNNNTHTPDRREPSLWKKQPREARTQPPAQVQSAAQLFIGARRILQNSIRWWL